MGEWMMAGRQGKRRWILEALVLFAAGLGGFALKTAWAQPLDPGASAGQPSAVVGQARRAPVPIAWNQTRAAGVLRDAKGVPCNGSQGGGGALPFGPNQVAELQDGELYQLKGLVRVSHGGSEVAYLEVDFCAHPWLASAKRRENPRYLLGQPVAGSWNSWADKKVEIAVRARHQIDVDADYRGQLVIWLESLQLPTFDKSGEMQPQRKK